MERLIIKFVGMNVPAAACRINSGGGVDGCKVCGDFCYGECGECPVQECFDKLAAYEDTGLEPEEIMDGKMLTGWILVEERLPVNESHVLATFDDGFVATVTYSGDWELWEDSGDVIAWMPLPEPYKPREVEN